MSPRTGATAVLLVGVLLVRLVVSGDYLRYVRGGMAPWLVASGVLLAVLGAAGLVGALRRPAPSPAHDHHAHDHHAHDHHAHDHDLDHGHDHGGERVGWLLLAPVVVLLLVAPPALGSFGVGRTAGVTVRSGTLFRPLAAGATPVALTLAEFGQRAGDRGGASFAGAQVELTGFVAQPRDGSGVRLARYQIACCAADAVADVARLVGLPGAPPARDTWLTVVGTFRGVGPDGVPELAVAGSRAVPAPVDPYET